MNIHVVTFTYEGKTDIQAFEDLKDAQKQNEKELDSLMGNGADSAFGDAPDEEYDEDWTYKKKCAHYSDWNHCYEGTVEFGEIEVQKSSKKTTRKARKV